MKNREMSDVWVGHRYRHGFDTQHAVQQVLADCSYSDQTNKKSDSAHGVDVERSLLQYIQEYYADSLELDRGVYDKKASIIAPSFAG
jgi:hypothetical protein